MLPEVLIALPYLREFLAYTERFLEPGYYRRLATAKREERLKDAQVDSEIRLIEAHRDGAAAVVASQYDNHVEFNHALGKLAVSDLGRRTLYRIGTEQIRYQKNIEDVLVGALDYIESDADPTPMNDDWYFDFMSKCKMASDDDVKRIWSKIIAGEWNKKGSFKKRTLHVVAGLDQDEGASFGRLCRFCWQIEWPTPLIFALDSRFYVDQAITFDALNTLDTAGLLRFTPPMSFQRNIGGIAKVSYFGKEVLLTPKAAQQAPAAVPIGCVLLSQAGAELAGVVEAEPIPGFFEYIISEWGQIPVPLEIL